ncbi:ribosomal RNA small subunit methyltransferase B [Clostridia bacterium]|nr:ribosomal RNA small subunit methyltransferase B [Clostridia bacterium]
MTAREAALKAVSAWRRSGAWSDLTFRKVLSGMPPLERALATRIGYGVITYKLTLDECVRQVSGIGLSRIEPLVLDILRVSAYQLLFMDKIPKSAAVDEGVRLTKNFAGKRAVSYVNAVLRKISRWDGLPEFPDLSTRLSYPQWFAQALTAQEGEERAVAFMQDGNTPPPLCLQLPKGGTLNVENARPHPFMPDCLLLDKSGGVEEIEGFREGKFLVADAAARLVVKCAAPKTGEKVFDACAAPGGKTVLMHWETEGLRLTAGEMYPHRMSILRETLAKYGIDGVQYTEGSAARRDQSLVGVFDLVLADVPCSGTGVIRKKPDIRYKKRDDVEAMPEIQKTILGNLADYVAVGGRLVYATCSVLKAENDGIVDWFLNLRPDFAPDPFELTIGKAPDGRFTVWPPEHNMDGFFMARLRRIS